MPTLTIRDLPLDVHQALKTRARAHGRSTEAEVRAILQDAARPEGDVRVGDLLVSIGKSIGGVELDIRRDRQPAPYADFS
ncbi:FitA-like ribbon-helix-helix domain-containing protein [Sinimarinibacterium thermocellulolyticum]|uniref:Arc family DNA-binding protein n=1 Tax=Sinimarinibacterium thermocellulolyticum TaxID=3170016 RepID=A0ABV2AB82_9GAMM